MACKAKDGGKVSRRGEPSVEWYKDGKPQYYCYGYIDKMTEELLPECKECRIHVYKAQDDLDEYNRRKENDYDLQAMQIHRCVYGGSKQFGASI